MKNNQSDEKRYTDLKGYPLQRPLWQVFHQSVTAQATVATLCVGTVADMMLNDGSSFSSSLLKTASYFIIPYATATLLEHQTLKRYFPDLNAQVVDTRPDSNTPPTSAADLGKSLSISKIASGMLPAIVAVSCLVNGRDIFNASTKNGPEFCNILNYFACSLVPYIAMYGSLKQRFGNVVNHSYAIVSPPPKKIEKKVEAAKTQVAFQPT